MSKVKKVIIAIGSFLAVCKKIYETLQKGVQAAHEAREKVDDIVQCLKEVSAIWQDVFGRKPTPCAGMA